MKRLLLSVVALCASSSALAITSFDMPWVNHPVRDTRYVSTDHADGIFVMEFAANFCGACNENAPNVDQLATDYSGEPRVQVLDTLIDSDDREIARWIARHRPNHPVLKDVGRRVWAQLNESYIPTMIITNCRGEVQYRHTGGWDAATKRAIRAKIDQMLGETCVRD